MHTLNLTQTYIKFNVQVSTTNSGVNSSRRRSHSRPNPGSTPSAAHTPGGTPSAARPPGGTPSVARRTGGTPSAAPLQAAHPQPPHQRLFPTVLLQRLLSKRYYFYVYKYEFYIVNSFSIFSNIDINI